MKITIDGKVHTDGALLTFLRAALDAHETDARPMMDPKARHAAEDLLYHDEHYDAATGPLGVVEIVGHPSEDLQEGMVLLSIGPVSIECGAADLCRAMTAFTGW